MKFSVSTVSFLLAIAVVAVTGSVASGCGSGWVQSPGTGRCYKFVVDRSLNWGDAQGLCSVYGGRLATLRTSDDLVFVNGYRVTYHGFKGDFWLGGRKINNLWYWNTSPPAQRIASNLMLWEPTQPDNCCSGAYCLQMIARSDGKVRWDDTSCSYLKHFICEKDSY